MGKAQSNLYIAEQSKDLTDRQTEFDIARGIAMIAVVFSHNGRIPSIRGIISLENWINPYFIALFFIISGYFINITTTPWKRVRKLVGEYLKYTTFLFLISLVIPSKHMWYERIVGALYARYCFYPNSQEDNIFFMSMANHPLWFIAAMSLATLLFFMLVNKSHTLHAKFIITVALILVGYALANLPILLPWSIDTISILTLFMLIGYWLRRYECFKLFWRSKKRWFLFSFFVMIYYVMVKINKGINISVRLYGGENRFYNILMYTLIGIIGSFLCIVVCRLISTFKIGRWIAIIGTHTLPIMGLHVMFYQGFMKVFLMFHINIESGGVIQDYDFSN